MHLLFVFNNDFEFEEFTELCEKFHIKEVSLFSLTSSIEINRKIVTCCNNIKSLKVIVFDSARIIDDQVTIMRNEICQWSAHLGESKIGAKTVKEWLLLPGLNVSSWWFSLLSEKNNYKTNAFFKIAQVNSVHHIIRKRKYDVCGIAISDITVCESLFKLFDKEGVKEIYSIGYHHENHSVNSIFREGSTFSLYLKEIKSGFNALQSNLKQTLIAKMKLGNMRTRLKNVKNESLLFVSYFPALDKEAAKEGIFVNKYAGSLQEKLRREKIPIIWLLMFVDLENYQFKDAVNLVKAFVNKGERIFLLEEFLTYTDIIKALCLWIRQTWISIFIFRYIERMDFNYQSLDLIIHKPIIKNLWLSSFSGAIGMQGILFSLVFRNAFKTINKIKHCLYYCEMHAWEKALNAAKKHINPKINSIGFQHVSLSKNFFHYFYDKSETFISGKKEEMPLPDILACNGVKMRCLLSESNYPHMMIVEAIRQLYLADIISKPYKKREGRPVLLVVGSILEDETNAIVALAHNSFENYDDIRIDFKGHPAMPMERIFDNINIKPKKNSNIIRKDDISRCLEEAWIVLVPSTTVSIEALVYGCEVIIPFFPDFLTMNPLVGFENYYHKVTNADELKETVKHIIEGYICCDINEYREFVQKYWELDKSMSKWIELLKS